MIDSHYHFDFIDPSQWEAMAGELARRHLTVIAQTLTPSSYASFAGRWEGHPSIIPALGYHPWKIETWRVEAELEIFADHITSTSFIGEVGLDYADGPLSQVPRDLQIDVFRRTLEIASTTNHPTFLSIHTVRSASDALDLLEDVSENVTPIFHRFNGSSDELTRIIRSGGYLSIHPHMITTKRGRAYICHTPADRLLLETDLPQQPTTQPAQELADELQRALEGTLDYLGAQGIDVDRVKNASALQLPTE